jgi:Zn-dependent metalloprotease
MISRIFSGIHPELITPCCNAPPAPDGCLLDLVWADLEGKGEAYVYQQMSHRHSIFCILPPYVLRRIALTGTEEQRQAALETLAVDTTFRTLRAIRLATPVATTTPAMAVPSAEVLPEEAKQLQRTIFTCQNRRRLPGEEVRSEGGPATGDPAVDEAYDGLGATYDFYWEVLRRNSIDDQGMPLNGHVHYGRRYNNAFWDGQRMVFGDGDGVLTNRFTISVDIMGHELTHGVTEKEAQLIYYAQSGALNESVSDVYGSLVKQYTRGNEAAEDADWLIGEGLFTEEVNGVALRSMKEPGTAFEGDEQPGHMRDYVNTREDDGGVHINSGIPNKAFYLAASEIGGYAGEKAGPIWYATLRDPRLKPNASFEQFARLTVVNAEILFPGGREERIVRNAWRQVGINV